MSNYIFQVLTPKVSTRFVTKARINTQGLHAGSIIVADTLDNTIVGNYETYTTQMPTTATLGSKCMAVLLNDEFETLIDGRRPAGNPNYYSYTYQVGQTVTAVFLEKHLMYNVGYDCVSQASQNLISVGNYLVPTNNSYELTAVESIPAGTYCALKILSFYNTPTGGNYGAGFGMSMICTPVFNEIDEGDYILSFNVPNQVGNTVINNVDNTITLSVAASRAALAPTFTISTDATITVNNVPQVSGVTTNNYTSPVTYVVTSESGESRTYTVTISLATYNLSVETDGYTTVQVMRSGQEVQEGENVLSYGDSITATATPNAGHEDSEFTINGEDYVSGSAYQVTGNVSIYADTVLIPYTLTVNATNATVSIEDQDGTVLSSGETIYYGDNLTITATPAETFANVTLQVNSQEFTSGNTYAVTGDVTVDATGTN